MRNNSHSIAATMALVAFVLVLFLTACAPVNKAVLASIPESTPTATAATTETPVPTPTATAATTETPVPTPTATPSPEPTPQMTREEALKRLNITSDEDYSYADLIIYECTLENGREVKFLTSTRVRVSDGTFVELNATDFEPFAEYIPLVDMSQFNKMDNADIKLIPEFLKGATITSTYGACNIPDIYMMRGMELPKSEYIDYIIKYMADGADPYVLSEMNLTALDCANILLDICPLDQMVWANDYIEGFIEETPEVK